MQAYVRPAELEQALALLDEQAWLRLAGGTDIYPAHVEKPLTQPVLDLSRITGLRGVRRDATGFHIGALTTWTDIIRADLPPAFDALKLAAREVGSVQVQYTGTVAGNLCNASPAADGVPPLLILDAEVALQSVEGTRGLPLDQFVLGNRRTALQQNELLTGIHIPAASADGTSTFTKLGARKYLVISIAMIAVRLTVEAGQIVEAAVAVGACSEVAQRMPLLERAIMAAGTFDTAMLTAETLAPLSPIDDVRADADYRRRAAAELIERAMQGARSA